MIMEAGHLVFLLVITGALVCALAGVSLVLWRGYRPAGLNHADGSILWSEATNLLRQRSASLKLKVLQLLGAGKLWSKVRIATSPPVSDYVIADPVDGTAFQEGETIIQCACGTNYHQQSWEWIVAKNAGNCVNCKRSRLITTLALPRFG